MSAPAIQSWMYYPALPLALLGLVGLYCSLFKGRARGRRRCPGCWYDLAGVAPPATCPECGRKVAAPRDLLRTRRHWPAALLSLALIAPLAVVFGRLHAPRVYYALMPRWTAVEEVEWNGATITRYRVRDPQALPAERVLVRAGGNHLLDHEDRSISLTGYLHDREPLVDLDNDDVKECVIECSSGGAHCCYRVFIVKLLAMGPAVVADIDARSGMTVIPPASPAGEWLLNIPDQTFDYWKVSHAESPMPPVFYRLHSGALRVALYALDKDSWTRERIEAAIPRFKAGMSEAGVTPDRAAPWRSALELLYAGHEDQAFEIVSRAAPSDALTAEFKQMLANDPWYHDVKDARAAVAAGKPIPEARIGKSGGTTLP